MADLEGVARGGLGGPMSVPHLSRRTLLKTAGFAGAGALAAVAVGGGPGLRGLLDGLVGAGLGAATSFGSVAVLGAERGPRFASPPTNHTWGDVVSLDLAVENRGGQPVLVSPGQLRLRIGAAGPTVTPDDADHAATAVAAGATERMRVTYLAPSEERELGALFDDPWLESPLELPLPVVVRSRGTGGAHHG